MQCGLYGKLPTKRDFIAIGISRGFLDAWEPWLQAGVSASRAALGDQWQQAFLTAPIWRFWLGADLCGTSVIGAFMPSLDGVGRYFPLTLLACADEGAAIAPPELDAQDDWFTPVETFLISTLDHDKTFDATVADLNELPLPSQSPPDTSSSEIFFDHDAMLGAALGEQSFTDLFGSLRNTGHDRIYASTSFWWTVGGDGFAPTALCGKRMPDPFLFSAMLTGEFKGPQS